MWKLAAAFCLTGLAVAGSGDLDRARQLYNSTDFDRSLAVLRAIPNKDAAVLELTGENYYMLTDYKSAADCFEKAVAAAPADSELAHWLARAYGRRAETSNPFSAPGYASKARRYLERAIELDPRNLDALNDLFDYYLDAPGFLGGGADKAQALSGRIAVLSPADGYAAQAKLDEKRKEYGAAEIDLRRAAAAAPRQIGKLIALAKVLAHQGKYQDADKAIAAAEQIAPDSPRVLFAKADLYIKTNRNLDEARKLLERYLASSLTPDDPPRADARKLLREASGS